MTISELGYKIDDFMDASAPWVYRLGFILAIGGLCLWAVGAVCLVVLTVLFFLSLAGALAIAVATVLL